MRPPRFWFRPPHRPGVLPRLLSPLSLLWQQVELWRWKLGLHVKMPVPVVCVGNINMGGTGKTPTVIEVVKRLQDLGKKPHIVTRGYRGTLAGPVKVDPQAHKADETGDEPLLLAEFAPCWVAKDRLAGTQAAISAGADVVVLDDGMQNPALAPDLTILVADAEIGFGNGRVFPAGPLRQTVDAGVARADLVLAIGPEKARKEFQECWPEMHGSSFMSGKLQPLETGMDWIGLRAVAFAGIGRPEKFFATLRGLGAEVVASHAFSDHQQFSEAVLRRMENEAWEIGAQLVTTEKDAVRLPLDFRPNVLTLPVRLELDNAALLVERLKALFG